MVNKVVIGIIIVILVASLAIGGLVASQLGGGDNATDSDGGDGGNGDDGDGGDATSTPENATTNETETNGTATGTPEANGTASPDPTETAAPTETATRTNTTPTATPTEVRTTIAAREFNETVIRQLIVDGINERRQDQGVDPLVDRGRTAERLRSMATNHSRAMAKEGAVVHVIAGNGTPARYRANDLYSVCSYEPPDRNGLRTPDNNFETLALTEVGQYYQRGGEERFNGNESQVAETVVENWFNSNTYRDRLLAPGLDRIGVGLELLDSGELYVTVDLCG